MHRLLLFTFLLTLHAAPSRAALNLVDRIGLHPAGPGARPCHRICADQSRRRAFLTGYETGNIAVLNMDTRQIAGFINVGGNPDNIDLDEITQKLCWTLPLENSIGLVSMSGGPVTKVATGGGDRDPSAIAFSQSTDRIYVANFNTEEIAVVLRPGNTLETRIALPADIRPVSLAVDHSRLRLYVGCQHWGRGTGHHLYVIDIDPASASFHTVVDQFDVIGVPGDLAVNETTNRVYTGNGAEPNVVIVDVQARQIRFVRTGAAVITGVAVDAANNIVWAGGQPISDASGWLFRIDGVTEQVIDSTHDCTSPWADVVLDGSNDAVYYAGGIAVGRWSGGESLEVIPTCYSPTQIALNPATDRLWVGDFTLDVIHEADSIANEVVRRLAAGDTTRHHAVAYDPSGVLLATCQHVPQPPLPYLGVIDLVAGGILASPTLDNGQPEDVVVNPVSLKAYVANTASKTVNVVDINPFSATRWQVIKSILINIPAVQPTRLAVDASRNLIYVRSTVPLGLSYISAIDGATDQIIKTRCMGDGYAAYGVTTLPELGRVYLGCLRPGLVGGVDTLDGDPLSPTFLDTTQETTTPRAPWELCADPNAKRIYAACCFEAAEAYAIDGVTGRVISSIETDKWLRRIAVDPETRLVYIGSDYTSSVLVYHDLPEVPLGDMKALPDGTMVELSGMRVSAGSDQIDSGIYVEAPDRSSGIRVRCDDLGIIPEGARVDVFGMLATLPSGEREIQDALINRYSEPLQPPLPLGMPNRSVGGGDYRYDPGPPKRGQQGVKDGAGLNNVGLLVRTWGQFTYVDEHTFRINDGFGLSIKCVAPDVVTLDPNWTYVAVSGISSCQRSGEDIVSLILVRKPGDIVPL